VDWPSIAGLCDALAVRNPIGIIVAGAAAVAAFGCKESVSVEAKVGAGGPEQPIAAAPAAPPVTESAPEPVVQTDYFGVARGLSLSEGKRDAVCACVSAAVGRPTDPAFHWQSAAPKVGADALVIAISSDGVGCEIQGNGASIRAVDRVGDDVVVVLEEHHSMRPKALGAIIPNPGANGGVYLRGEARAPYGKPLGTAAGPHGHWCLVAKGTGASANPAGTRPSEAPTEPKDFHE
jgi:hypothetical protein